MKQIVACLSLVGIFSAVPIFGMKEKEETSQPIVSLPEVDKYIKKLDAQEMPEIKTLAEGISLLLQYLQVSGIRSLWHWAQHDPLSFIFILSKEKQKYIRQSTRTIVDSLKNSSLEAQDTAIKNLAVHLFPSLDESLRNEKTKNIIQQMYNKTSNIWSQLPPELIKIIMQQALEINYDGRTIKLYDYLYNKSHNIHLLVKQIIALIKNHLSKKLIDSSEILSQLKRLPLSIANKIKIEFIIPYENKYKSQFRKQYSIKEKITCIKWISDQYFMYSTSNNAYLVNLQAGEAITVEQFDIQNTKSIGIQNAEGKEKIAILTDTSIYLFLLQSKTISYFEHKIEDSAFNKIYFYDSYFIITSKTSVYACSAEECFKIYHLPESLNLQNSIIHKNNLIIDLVNLESTSTKNDRIRINTAPSQLLHLPNKFDKKATLGHTEMKEILVAQKELESKNNISCIAQTYSIRVFSTLFERNIGTIENIQKKTLPIQISPSGFRILVASNTILQLINLDIFDQIITLLEKEPAVITWYQKYKWPIITASAFAALAVGSIVYRYFKK